MGRGVSSGGGQSSLGYLFGSSDEPKPASTSRVPVTQSHQSAAPENLPPAGLSRKVDKAEGSSAFTSSIKLESISTPEAEASTLGRSSSSYGRADGENAGNFITDRPSTKVHSVPGGGSSLGYLFGSNDK